MFRTEAGKKNVIKRQCPMKREKRQLVESRERHRGDEETYEITITEITDARHDELLLVEMRVDHGGDDANTRIGGLHGGNALGGGNEIEKDNVLLENAMLEEDANGAIGRATGGEHGIEKKNLALADVLGQLDIDQLGQGSLFVTLNQNLANANRFANRAKRS